MSNIPPKPLMVLACLEGHGDTLHWWLRRSSGLYEMWPEDSTELSTVVDAYHLVPAQVDFQRYCGDHAAILEIQNKRNQHSARADA